MHRLLPPLLVLAFAISGFAASKPALSGSSLPRVALPEVGHSRSFVVGGSPASLPRLSIGSYVFRPGERMITSASCLKLRTYKVARTERLREGDTGRRGYSTCQWASDYQVQSAVGVHILRVPAQ